ncbi:MAG: cytochrome c, partial [Psychroflexus sp.]|nr:cytochrome c [Psychroflexus sp.]
GEPQKESKKDNKVSLKKTTKKESKKADKKEVKASERVALDNKGVGPIKNLDLPESINDDMAANGKAVYDKMCTACHKIDKKFIGPAPTGILERRAPEWVMNMILNPEEMVRKDPLAKDLLMEFNGSPMANQGLTEEEARSVLEYFRTL